MSELDLDFDQVIAQRVQARERLSATTQVMRFGGALMLTAAASSFMLQHWQDGGSATRYAYLLGHTLLLALSGIVCGLRMRESRAARTFFALVLASTPVHFAVLGGMLRSVFPLDRATVQNDLWPMHSVPLALGLLAVGVAVIGPLVHLALLALCRPCARPLTGATLLVNACLLLPWRSPTLIAVLCGAMLLVWFTFDARVVGAGYAARTAQARYARALVAAPIAIAATRAALWYDPSWLAYGAFGAASGLALFWAAPRVFASYTAQVQAAAAAVAVAGVTCMVLCVNDATLPIGLVLPWRVLPECVLLAALSGVARHHGAAYRSIAALVAGTTLTLDVFACWDAGAYTWAGGLATGIGSALLAGGIFTGQRLVFSAGILPALLGLAQLFVASIEFEHLRNWGTLSLLGGALIFAAAVLERHAERLLGVGRSLAVRLSTW